jgi:hypothetical protein
MKEILENLALKLIKKGNVTVHAKKVTKMLVEGKIILVVSSKPCSRKYLADALDKIEVIDHHFNEVGFMKQALR